MPRPPHCPPTAAFTVSAGITRIPHAASRKKAVLSPPRPSSPLHAACQLNLPAVKSFHCWQSVAHTGHHAPWGDLGGAGCGWRKGLFYQEARRGWGRPSEKEYHSGCSKLWNGWRSREPAGEGRRKRTEGSKRNLLETTSNAEEVMKGSEEWEVGRRAGKGQTEKQGGGQGKKALVRRAHGVGEKGVDGRMVLVKRALVRQLVAEAGARMNAACKDSWDGCADRGGSDQLSPLSVAPPSLPLAAAAEAPRVRQGPLSDWLQMDGGRIQKNGDWRVKEGWGTGAGRGEREAVGTRLVASMAIITTTTSIAPPFSSARAAGGSDRMGAWASPAELRAWAGSPDRWLKVSYTSPCRASCPPRARPSHPLRPPYKLLHCRHHITMGRRHTVATCAGTRKPTLPAHVSGHAEHAVRLHAWEKGEASRGQPAVSRPSGQEGGGGDNVQAEQVGHEGKGDGEADGKGGWAGGWVREEGKVGGEGEQEGGGEGDRQVTKADGKGSGEEGEERVGNDERRGSGEGHGGEAVRR
ncbi:unnamed protein product [Closterium sp. NIES-65]|nr:unnamed protein product [Closterium sp. NIES-65]CAI6007172.1 unnamed protein product [Closterium sp. NIES-65]